MLRRFLFALALLSPAGCATYLMGPEASVEQDARDVAYIVQNRHALDGQLVLLNGFLTRRGSFFFVSQGKRRPVDAPGEMGERYWCSYEGQPSRIWFSDTDLAFQWNNIRAQYGAIPNDISRGRLVILRGILTNEPPRPPLPQTDLRAFSEENLARRSVGPLRHVQILTFFDQRCSPD